MPRYDPKRIEPKWQAYWEENATFRTPDLPEGEKLYVLDMFPYPSGQGLHVGHPEGYTATDIVCRYNRMLGRSVQDRQNPRVRETGDRGEDCQPLERQGRPPLDVAIKRHARFLVAPSNPGAPHNMQRARASTETIAAGQGQA